MNGEMVSKDEINFQRLLSRCENRVYQLQDLHDDEKFEKFLAIMKQKLDTLKVANKTAISSETLVEYGDRVDKLIKLTSQQVKRKQIEDERSMLLDKEKDDKKNTDEKTISPNMQKQVSDDELSDEQILRTFSQQDKARKYEITRKLLFGKNPKISINPLTLKRWKKQPKNNMISLETWFNLLDSSEMLV
eukprot:TRINITY_DN15357_c0_g1_i1.p1 TRINITY_DN15357_c0_g1~~TRINITY_DN15357_c0_g1_i1.p1  ORF type:complete len:190 (-),score=30.16 TRINITY_DN15357_c0_g1_i1:286-855(-)